MPSVTGGGTRTPQGAGSRGWECGVAVWSCGVSDEGRVKGEWLAFLATRASTASMSLVRFRGLSRARVGEPHHDDGSLVTPHFVSATGPYW